MKKIDYKAIIKKPRITEKSGIKSESENVYTFEVVSKATKDIVGVITKLLKSEND